MNMPLPSALAKLPPELSPHVPALAHPVVTTHLVAVNCHPFHRPEDILRCLTTLIPEIVSFRRDVAGTVAVRVFWHRPDDPSPGLRLLLAASGLSLSRLPHLGNGPNLNAQIDYAIRCGYDLFFRVDADDTALAQRFVAQASLLTRRECDICGCALLYQPAKGAGYVTRPARFPGPRDFVENRFLLHPTMAARVESLAKSGLRYGAKRLEDKEFFLHAIAKGLVIRNLNCVGGEYFLQPGARSAWPMVWRAFRLNLRFLRQADQLRLIPYAALLSLAHASLGPALLRRIRAAIPR